MRHTHATGYRLLPLLGLVTPAVCWGDAVAADRIGDVIDVALNLLLVLGLIAVLGWALRRYQSTSGSGNGVIRVVAAIPLGSKERAVLVQVGDEQVLVGVGPGGMTSLHVLSEPVAAEDTGPVSDSFAQRLGEALRRTDP